jgi:DNA-binding GntR family transcriptional regulator
VAAIASATRLQLLVIDSPSTWNTEHPAHGCPKAATPRTGTLNWIQYGVKWIPSGKVDRPVAVETNRRDERSEALVDHLAAMIRGRVLSGEIEVGSRLRQERLAAEFGVSRTPIREALRKLQASGIVELRPNRSAVVRGPTAREIREAYEVRAELEGLAAELAAVRIGDAHLQELHAAQRLFGRSIAKLVAGGVAGSRADDANGEWTRANDLFHGVIQEAAGNERLGRIVQDLHRAFPRGLTWSALRRSSRLLEQNVEEHLAILAAIERRDRGEARRTMVAHVRHAGELIAHHFERELD